MPLLIHSGSNAVDLGPTGTKRDDISDVLLASLYFENNALGITTVGEDFADLKAQWNEDALNQFKITDTAGQTTGSTAMTVSASDASVLDVGYLLMEDLQVGNPPATNGEVVQIATISSTTVTITRAYGGTVATAHNASAVWRIINAPTYTNSDLGKDVSRARLQKQNWINRWEINVNIDSEQIERSKAGYAPGISDELQYQFEQRLLEKKRLMQQAYWYSLINTSATGNDYQTMAGVVAWLNTTANATASPITTAESLTDSVVNTMVKNIYRGGGFSNVLAGGINVTEKISQLYADRIRIEQNDRNRGFYAQYFTPTMANEHRILTDAYLNDTQGSALALILDLTRIRIRPFINQFFFLIMAETFRDGDAVRALCKWSLEVRNSGTDVGFSHQLHTNLSV